MAKVVFTNQDPDSSHYRSDVNTGIRVTLQSLTLQTEILTSVSVSHKQLANFFSVHEQMPQLIHKPKLTMLH